MSAAERAARRRAKAKALRAEGLSFAEIARRLNVSKSTVHADVTAEEPERAPVPNLQDEHGQPVAGAEPGNARALTHGAHSPRLVEPRAEVILERVEELCAGTPAGAPPFAPARRVLARRLAQAELVQEWLERENAGSPLDADGAPLPAAGFEQKVLDGIERSLDLLGLTPTSAAKLGVDLQRAAASSEELAAVRAARERLDARAADVVDAEPEPDAAGDDDGGEAV